MITSGPKEYPAHEELEAETPESDTSLTLMAAMVGEGKRVLDVGCASGYFARLLRKNDCVVTGVDANPEALAAASDGCERTILADLDIQRLLPLLDGATFDVIAFGDVLEHLRDPLQLLEEARGALAEGGYIVASIPNIAHGAIRLSMLSGRFDYAEYGLLDESHVRFFTAKSLDEIFLCAGFAVDRTERTSLPLFERSELVPEVDRDLYPPETVAEIERDPECETLQFVVRATPLDDAERHAALTRRFLEANTALAASTARMEAQARTLDAVRVELDETRRHLAEADREMRIAQQSFREAEVARATALERVFKLTEDLRTSEATGQALAAALGEIDELRATVTHFGEELARLQARLDPPKAAPAKPARKAPAPKAATKRATQKTAAQSAAPKVRPLPAKR